MSKFKVGDRVFWAGLNGNAFPSTITAVHEVETTYDASLDDGCRVEGVEGLSLKHHDNVAPQQALQALSENAQEFGIDYAPASPEHEAEVDKALGLTKLTFRLPTELYEALKCGAAYRGRTLAAHIRELLDGPQDGNWYTSDMGSIVVDWDQDVDRQLSIILKIDGSVAYAANVQGKKFVGFNAMTPEFYDVLRELTGSVPAEVDAAYNEFFRCPGKLNPKTANLVARFATALADKLFAAHEKYGWDAHWESPSWMDQCREQLIEHVAKGDPRDVAAYCAFLWHHGEKTSSTPTQQATIRQHLAEEQKDAARLEWLQDHLLGSGSADKFGLDHYEWGDSLEWSDIPDGSKGESLRHLIDTAMARGDGNG